MPLHAGKMLRIPTTLLLGLLLLPAAVPAQTASQPAKNAPNASDSALPVVVALDAQECRRLLGRQNILMPHQPAPDVNYQPGRDVDSQGRPITPADLPGSNPLPLDGMIQLPLVMPLSSLPGMSGLSQIPPEMKRDSGLAIAMLAIDPMSGKLAFNGRPLEAQTEDTVAVACRDYLAKAQSQKR
jgi:hypothetical protein